MYSLHFIEKTVFSIKFHSTTLKVNSSTSKLPEKVGRKTIGLSPLLKNIAAGLPGEYSAFQKHISHGNTFGGTMKTLSRRRSKAKITPCSCLSWILFNVSVTALYFIVSSTIACAGQITLGWDKSTEADVVGYKIYYGTASGNYTQNIKITSPNITTCTILNLLNGQKYYFAATAYNKN